MAHPKALAVDKLFVSWAPPGRQLLAQLLLAVILEDLDDFGPEPLGSAMWTAPPPLSPSSRLVKTTFPAAAHMGGSRSSRGSRACLHFVRLPACERPAEPAPARRWPSQSPRAYCKQMKVGLARLPSGDGVLNKGLRKPHKAHRPSLGSCNQKSLQCWLCLNHCTCFFSSGIFLALERACYCIRSQVICLGAAFLCHCFEPIADQTLVRLLLRRRRTVLAPPVWVRHTGAAWRFFGFGK